MVACGSFRAAQSTTGNPAWRPWNANSWKNSEFVPTAPAILLRSGNDGTDQGEWFTETYLVAAISGEPRILEPEKCAELGFFRMDSPPIPLLRAARLDLEALMVRGDRPEM